MKTIHWCLLAVPLVVGCAFSPETPLAENQGVALVDFGDGELQEVVFEDVDGSAIIDGDILLGRTEDVLARPTRFALERQSGPVAIGAGSVSLWPHGVIRYRIDTGLSRALTDQIEDAIEDWNQTGFIQFIEDDGGGVQGHHLYITGNPLAPGVGVAAVGYSPPALLPPGTKWQELRLGGATSLSTARHELGHTIGLFHEQSRSDRDEHIDVFWSNILWYQRFNFRVHDSGGLSTGEYNIRSLMHYGPAAFAVSPAFPTMVPKGCPNIPIASLPWSCRVGSVGEIQESDRRTVVRMYAGAAVQLRNDASNRCLSLDPARINTSNASDGVITEGCSSSSRRQRWHLLPWANTNGGPPGSAYQIVNAETLRCLSRFGDDLVQTACAGHSLQQFHLTNDGPGKELRAVDGSGCVRQIPFRRSYRESVRLSAYCSGTDDRRWLVQSIVE